MSCSRRSPSRCSLPASRVPWSKQSKCETCKDGAKPDGLPVGEAFVERDVDGRRAKHGGRHGFGGVPASRRARAGESENNERHRGGAQRREREIAITRVEC